MSAVELPPLAGPVVRSAWEAMSPAMRKTAVSSPAIPAIAARAKLIAAESPDFIRGDQGQVVGVLPAKEIYYGPSSGLPELRRLVGRFWTLAYGLEGREGIPTGGLGPEHVAVVSGATEGLAILLRMLAPGRKIGLQRLHWGNYRNLIAHAGGEHVLLDWFRPDGGLDIEGVTAAVETHGLRVLIMNFPANPTGDVMLDHELQAVADLARERDLVLVSDEVYNWVRYDDKPRSLLGFAPERTIVVGAASKEYLIPGARTGYVICPDETFANEWMPRLIRATSSSPNVLGQQATLELLGPDVADLEAGDPPGLLSTIKEKLRLRLSRMSEVLVAAGFTIEGRFPQEPRGGISLLARLPDGLDDDVAFLDTAMELGRFSAIPGSAFGAPGCVRFGYAGIPLEAIERMREGLRVVLDASRRVN
jgi:aspartate/methionine/tyrosine aminotransferase